MIDVTVIIPVYNVEKYLGNCIQSMISQSKKNIEVICVDDGSTDGSGMILDNFASLDERIIVVHSKNKGTLLARKTGVDLARGRYIMFLDGDDFYTEDACEIAYREVVKSNADILHFGMNVLNTGNAAPYEYEPVESCIRPYIGVLHDASILSECFDKEKYNYTLCDKMYRSDLCKSVFSYVSEENCCMAEDLLLYFLLSYFAKLYVGIPEKIYNYNFAIGITKPGMVDLERLDRRCSSAKACFAIKDFLDEQGKFQQYKSIYTKIERRQMFDNFDAWYYKLPIEQREEGYQIFLKNWGTEKVILALLYDIENKQLDIDQKGRSIEKKNKEIEILSAQNKELINELNEVKQRFGKFEEHISQSFSYKIGRIVTWLPRKIVKWMRQGL